MRCGAIVARTQMWPDLRCTPRLNCAPPNRAVSLNRALPNRTLRIVVRLRSRSMSAVGADDVDDGLALVGVVPAEAFEGVEPG